MGYVLLGLENLALALLLTATLFACLGRWRRRFWPTVLSALAALAILAFYGGLAFLAGCMKFAFHLPTPWFYPLAAMAAIYALGAACMLVAGSRPAPAGLSGPRSASWPRGKLAVALAVVLALHTMTLWNLDLAIRQRLETLRAEAGALALSVAPARVPDRDNAALVYQQAFQAMGDPASWPKACDKKWLDSLEPGAKGFDPKDTELRAFLKRQAGALALLSEAGRKPGCYFERDYGRPSIDMLLPELLSLRQSARILALDARVKAADGNSRGALDDCRAMLAMAEHAGSDPILVALLVSAAIDGMAATTLEAVLAAAPPSADDLRAVALDNFSYQRAFQRALRMEEAFGQGILYDVGTERCTIANIADGQRPDQAIDRLIAPIYRLFLLADDQRSYARVMKQCQQWAAQPYRQAKAGWASLTPQRTAESGILPRMLLPALNHCSEIVARADAQRSLMRLALAAYRCRAARGRLPGKADELVPEFIPAVSLDPFDGKPLRMKKTDRGLVLYSIGPDAVDNGGAPYDREKKTGDIPFTVVP